MLKNKNINTTTNYEEYIYSSTNLIFFIFICSVSTNLVFPYEFVVEGNKKIIKIEIDPSKRIADVNQLDNSVVID